MISPLIKVSLDGLPTELLDGIAGRLKNPAGIHTVMAGAAEGFLKKKGREKSKTEHNTAQRLGAKPTGHLEDAYNRVESSSNEQAASLWIPGASRLRAAFGPYTVTPTAGRKYLTIPVAAAAYGKRAAEIPGLIFMRVGPNKTPLLAKPDGEGITTYYLLAKSADIPADESLIPFDAMAEDAALAAEKWILGGDDNDPATPQ